jgi:hypothetical protein
MYTILLDILVFVSFATRQNEVIYESEQRLLDIQVNYATDAAAWMMLNETADIDIDYTDLTDIKSDPQVALQTYEAVMVRGLGWGDTDTTREYFEDSYMPFFIVAAYDGYYVYGVVRDEDVTTLNNGEVITSKIYPKSWTPKIPYATSDYEAVGNKAFIYMYTLGGDTYTIYSYADDQYVSGIDYKSGTGVGTKFDANELISDLLTDACQKSLLAAKQDPGLEQIIIPSSFSEWSSNRPVEYPTVLTYLDISYDSVKYDHSSFAIGGSRIDETDYYIAYKDEKGNNLYTHAQNRSDVETTRGLKVLHVYTSAVDAACNGYTYDVKYLK